MATVVHCPECAEGHTLPRNPSGSDGFTIRCLGCGYVFSDAPPSAVFREPSEGFDDGPMTEPLDRPVALFGVSESALEASVQVHVEEEITQLQDDAHHLSLDGPLHPEFDPTRRLDLQRTPSPISSLPPPLPPISELPESRASSDITRNEKRTVPSVLAAPAAAPARRQRPRTHLPPEPKSAPRTRPKVIEGGPSVYELVESGAYKEGARPGSASRPLSASEVVWEPPPVHQALAALQALPLVLKVGVFVLPVLLGATLLLVAKPKPIEPVSAGVVELEAPPPRVRPASGAGVLIRSALVRVRPHPNGEPEAELQPGQVVRVYDVRNGYLLVVATPSQVAGFVEASAVQLKPSGASVSAKPK